MLAPVAAGPELVAWRTARGGADLLAHVDVVDPGPEGEEAREGEGNGGSGDVEELLAGECHLGGC